MSAPKRPAIRRIPPGAPRSTTFPAGSGPELAREDASEVSQPGTAESASPISHVARRRGPSAPPPEVGSWAAASLADDRDAGDAGDGIELLAGSPDEDSRTIRRPVAALTATSLTPVAIPPAAMPVAAVDLFAPPAPPARWRARAMVPGGALVTLIAGIAIGVALRPDRTHVEPPAPPAAIAAAAPAAPPAPAPEPQAAAPALVADVAKPPRASVGTVVGAEGHRLWVDGHLADGFSAVVSCGHHTVQVGSAGTPRDIDVRCGQEIVVPR